MKSNNELKVKDAIYEAALTLFAEKGFHGVSMRDVTGLAECNVSAINYHYQSKEVLYNLCLYNNWDDFSYILNHTLQDVSTYSEFCDKIRYTIYHSLNHLVNNPHKFQLISRELYESSLSIEDNPLAEMEKIVTSLEYFIKKAQDKNFIQQKLDPKFIASFILETCFIRGVIFFRRSNKDEKGINFTVQTTDQIFTLLFSVLH